MGLDLWNAWIYPLSEKKCQTFSKLAGSEKEKGDDLHYVVSSARRKPDVVVPEWIGGIGLFDVGVTSVVPDGHSSRPAVEIKAQEKEESFVKVKAEMAAAFSAAAVSIDAWKFTLLIADTAGRWHSKAQETIKLLSTRLPDERRSTMVSLW